MTYRSANRAGERPAQLAYDIEWSAGSEASAQKLIDGFEAFVATEPNKSDPFDERLLVGISAGDLRVRFFIPVDRTKSTISCLEQFVCHAVLGISSFLVENHAVVRDHLSGVKS